MFERGTASRQHHIISHWKAFLTVVVNGWLAVITSFNPCFSGIASLALMRLCRCVGSLKATCHVIGKLFLQIRFPQYPMSAGSFSGKIYDHCLRPYYQSSPGPAPGIPTP